MTEYIDSYRKLKNKKISMLEERVEFNKTFTVNNQDLEVLKNEISPIYEKIMKDKDLWLQIAGDLDNPDKFNVKWTINNPDDFNIKWNNSMIIPKIPKLKKISVKEIEPDIKFNCECEIMCNCLDKNKCSCKRFTFEAHLRWGYGQGFANLRLDFK